MIPFNKPYLSGNELVYIKDAIDKNKISGDGFFTKQCHTFFEEKYGFKKCLLTTSCTDALEMAAILFNIKPGDEVIVPSYTFVSTVNAFELRGATIIFVDSEESTPNIDTGKLESLITTKTKVIVPVHYAGIACNMDAIMEIARKYNLFVVEDAAQAIDGYYKQKPLGSIGHLAAFSFHETKNIIAGEGGMLVINDEQFIKRAEIIREKGTNRSQFFRGEVDKYSWVDIGSSFLPSDIIAAFLFAQLESLNRIQEKRKSIWNHYYAGLKKLQDLDLIKLPFIPSYSSNNSHMFYIVCKNLDERTSLLNHLKENNVSAVFHYLSLHKSEYFCNKYQGGALTNADRYTDCLVRLPFYFELDINDQNIVIEQIIGFYKKLFA